MGNNIDTIHSAQLQPVQISSMILTVRDEPVMLDSDLAMLYGVETRVLNQAVKRNIARFPEHYRFQLTDEEKAEVITNCDNPDRIKFGPVAPYVSHDRFLCIDDTVYHIGASIKDLGKKWFAFSILEDTTPTDLLNKINGIA